MTEYYKGERIAELLAQIEKAELLFDSVDSEQLTDAMRQKLVRAKTLVCINKAKLTALQEDKQ